MKFQISIPTAIEAAEKNLHEHIAELADARTGWIEQLHAALDRFKAAVTRDGLKASHDELWRLMASRPIDNRPHYSRVISAFKTAVASGQTHVEMDEHEHDQVFNDNWDWRVTSKAANSTYSAASLRNG